MRRIYMSGLCSVAISCWFMASHIFRVSSDHCDIYVSSILRLLCVRYMAYDLISWWLLLCHDHMRLSYCIIFLWSFMHGYLYSVLTIFLSSC